MRIELHHIEKAVRKQFVWTEDPKTRWATHPAHNLGSKGLGATVFVGIATQLGYPIQALYDYLDLEELDIDAKLRAFNTRMREMLHRKLTDSDLDKKDMTQLLSVKYSMTISYLRLHHMKEFISSTELNH